TRCHLTPGFEGEPTMHPMSQAKRIRSERTRLTCRHIATPEATLIRIVLLVSHCHRTIKTRLLVVGRPFDNRAIPT
ncbi:MAG: hypothetical protein ACI9HK_004040, partial [Pirellulaceae bacterium]